jgi:peptidoglycan/xylan/chitin deacetylase (PgdA/CDA1 family)
MFQFISSKSMKILCFILLINLYALAGTWQFPEDRYYVPRVDIGYTQYNTPSILGNNEIVLTFDDGPHRTLTPQVLDLLKQYKVKATFFVLTHKFTKANYPILKRILKEGHIIASHDHYHNRNDYVTRDEFEYNLETSLKLIKDLYAEVGIEQPGYWYRFPYAQYGGARDYHHMNSILAISEKLFNQNCINFAFWDIDSGDWIPSLTPEDVFQSIKAHIEGGEYLTYKVVNGRILPKPARVETPLRGGVILQHDIQKRTVGALALLLAYAKKNNIKVVELNALPEFSYQDRDCKFLD